MDKFIDYIGQKWEDLDDDTKFNVIWYGGSIGLGLIIGISYAMGTRSMSKSLDLASDMAQETNSDVMFAIIDRVAKTRRYFKAIPIQTSYKMKR